MQPERERNVPADEAEFVPFAQEVCPGTGEHVGGVCKIHAFGGKDAARGDGDVHARLRLRHVLRTEIGGEHRAAIGEGDGVGRIGQRMHAHADGDADEQLLPRRKCGEKVPVLLLYGTGRAVFEELHVPCRPIGNAQLQGNLPPLYADESPVRKGKICLDEELRLRRLYLHREVLFEIKPCPAGIYGAVAQFGEALHAASRAAPELVERAGEHLEKSARHGLEVGGHARLGVLRGEDGVREGGIVIVGIVLIPRHAEQKARELEHIVDVARLAVAVGALGVEHIVRAEVLPFGVAARRIGVPLEHHAEEHLGDAQIARRVHLLARKLPPVEDEIALERAQNFRDGGVGVLVFKNVLPLREDAVEERLLVEDVRRLCMARLPRAGI